MKNRYILWILFSTFIISIGAGHGIGPIIMIQYWTILSFGAIKSWLLPTAFFTMGQLILLLGLFSSYKKNITFIVGIIFCISGIVNLIVIGQDDYNSAIPTYITAIPFTILVYNKVVDMIYNRI